MEIYEQLSNLVIRLEQLDIENPNIRTEIAEIKADMIQITKSLETEDMIKESLRKVKLRLAQLNANRDNPEYAEEYQRLKEQEQNLRRRLAKHKMQSSNGRRI